MTFEEAIKESIRKYYDPKTDETEFETNKLTPNKYDRKYFDDFEEERLGSEASKKRK
jgi:hypothetical protein